MSWLRPNRVLVPTDFSDAARRAVAEAAETIHDVSEIHVLHVVPVIDPDQPGIVWGEDPGQVDLEGARHRLLSWLAESNLEGVKAHVTTGVPAEEIVSVAEALGVDLIVIPSHGRTGLSRLLLGSVADRVARTATCPVLLVRSATD